MNVSWLSDSVFRSPCDKYDNSKLVDMYVPSTRVSIESTASTTIQQTNTLSTRTTGMSSNGCSISDKKSRTTDPSNNKGNKQPRSRKRARHIDLDQLIKKTISRSVRKCGESDSNTQKGLIVNLQSQHSQHAGKLNDIEIYLKQLTSHISSLNQRITKQDKEIETIKGLLPYDVNTALNLPPLTFD